MIKKTAAFCLIFLFSQLNMALAQEWVMDKQKSALDFLIAAEGTTIIGSFKEFDADIKLDPDDTSTAVVRAKINAASLSAGDVQVDSTALSRSWLFPQNFPLIEFTSTKIDKNEDGSFQMAGDLKVKEITKSIAIPFKLKIDGNNAQATSTFSLERAMFNLGAAGDAAPTITIKLKIIATKK